MEATRAHRIAVIGNSNSVAQQSYVRHLRSFETFEVFNFSIGGTPSILLLNTLIRQAEWDFDTVIVETCVIDLIQRFTVGYSPAYSAQVLDLFAAELRARSETEIIVLILPTMLGLLEPHRHPTEMVYIEFAARHGLKLLNVYQLLRDILGAGAVREAASLAAPYEELARLLGVAPGVGLNLAWRRMHRPGLRLSALGYYAFVDSAHISAPIHALIGDLIHAHILERGPNRPKIATRAAPEPARLASIDADTAPRRIERRSSLLARSFVALSPGEEAIYTLPPGHRVAGLMLNERQTYGFLLLRAGDTALCIDARLAAAPPDFISIIVPVMEQLRGPTLRLSVLAEAPDGVTLQLASNIRARDAQPAAEIAEVLTVAEAALAAPGSTIQPPAVDVVPQARLRPEQPIHRQPHAKPIIAAAQALMAREMDGVDFGGVWTERTLMTALRHQVATTDLAEPRNAASLLLLLGQERELMQVIDRQLAAMADDPLWTAARTHLAVLLREDGADPEATLAQARAAKAAGRMADCAQILLEGEARYPSEIAFPIELAWHYLHTGAPERSAFRWEQVSDLLPDNPIGFIGAAIAHLQAGHRSDAADAIKRGLVVLPGNGTLLAFLTENQLDPGETN
jgi:hypothetical protein